MLTLLKKNGCFILKKNKTVEVLLSKMSAVATVVSDVTKPSKVTAPQSTNQFYRRPLPSTCIDFASPEGKQIFAEALPTGHMNVFFKLCAQYRTQDEPAYCGLTSLVMALNVLEIDPGRIWKGPWRWYHEEMLDCCTPLQVARQKGINMEQFVCLARCNNMAVVEKSGSEICCTDELRSEVKQATKRDDIVFVVSYSRKTLGQTGDGHFSPIAGYHENRDLVLILDTARFKYPPHWVPLTTLLEAMKTIDSDTGRSRGYVKLSKAHNQPGLLLFRPSCAFSVDTQRGNINTQLRDFTTEWDKFLSSSVESFSESKDVIPLVVSNLLAMESHTNSCISAFCFTLPSTKDPDDPTKLIIQCPQNKTGGEEVSCAVRSLLEELEKLETFKVVREFLTSKSTMEKKALLSFIHVKSSCVNSEETVENSDKSDCCGSTACTDTVNLVKNAEAGQKGTKLPEDQSCLKYCTNCEGQFIIGPEHAVTLFLHAWPHTSVLDGTCTVTDNRNNVRQMLMEYISSDLSSSGGQCIREEINTIKFKLREVLNYHSKNVKKTCC